MKKFFILSCAVAFAGGCMPILDISTGEIITPESFRKMQHEVTNDSKGINNSTSETITEKVNAAIGSREIRFAPLDHISDAVDEQRAKILVQMESARKNGARMREHINKFNADYAGKMGEIEALDLSLSEKLEEVAFETYALLDEYFKNVKDFLHPVSN